MSKHPAKILGAITAALVVLTMFATAAQATTPKPGYTQFAGCPSPEENPAVQICIRSVITGGHFKMGTKEVPIANPIVLSGGILTGGNITANAKGGLVPTKEKVPGGVIGLTGLTWLAELLGSEALTLYAVTELVGVPNFGNTLKLPIRVHLINGILGSNCYVGSPTSPISLSLTTGTTSPPPPNSPITGVQPEFGFDEATEILTDNNGTFVDNSFSAPGASGCVLTLFGFIPVSINGLVNSQSGLPAAAGTNETVQNFDAELVQPSLVY